MFAKDFLHSKAGKRKLSLVTCYDYTFARLLSQTPIDAILVGDSVAMVMYGHPSTLPATIEMMRHHTEAVARGAGGKMVVADMPFLSFRKGVPAALDAAQALMSAGAHALKLEGVEGHEDVIQRMAQSGIPVMGHLGLQPQSVHATAATGFRAAARMPRVRSSARQWLYRNSARSRWCWSAFRPRSPEKLPRPCAFPPSVSARARNATGKFWSSRICWA